MTTNNVAVAIYKTHPEAEAAIVELQQSGFDMKKLSIIGRDYHTEEHVVGFYNTGDQMKSWGKTGAFWGSIWGWLFGSAFFFIPGVGPLLFAGPVIGWVVGALEGAVIVGGLSALGAGLVSMGVPSDTVVKYETALVNDKFVVFAHGTAADVKEAKGIINRTAHESVVEHGSPPVAVKAVA